MPRDAFDGFKDLLAAVPVSDEWKARLQGQMGARDRFYHGVDHVGLLFHRHLSFADEAGFDNAAETRLVACAIAFHDFIYEASRHDNEERSAQAWLQASAAGDFGEVERAWVADTIRATKDHLDYGQRAGATLASAGPEALRLWMLDLDLTPFGEMPDRFDRNTKMLRKEASHLSDDAFEAKLIRLLRRFAEAPIIFRTVAIAARFEARARSNIARRLSTAS